MPPINVMDMGLDELRLYVKLLQPYPAAVKHWRAEVKRLTTFCDDVVSECTACLPASETWSATSDGVLEHLRDVVARLQGLHGTTRDSVVVCAGVDVVYLPDYPTSGEIAECAVYTRSIKGGWVHPLNVGHCYSTLKVAKAAEILLACRRGEQRCHECPDSECCDNTNPEKTGGD